VANHACDYAGDSLVLTKEDGFQIEIRVANLRITRQFRRYFVWPVHTTITPLGVRL
jgi:hypothetical protein